MLSPAYPLLLAAGLALPATVAAQPVPTLLESYGRVTTLLSYMTAHVGEVMLACAEKNVLTEAQAETRYQAYRKRNALLLERAESWKRAAEKKLQAQGEERAARLLAEEAGLNAMAVASMHAHGLIGKAGDAGAACAMRLAAIESGHYDLSSNAEFTGLLDANP